MNEARFLTLLDSIAKCAILAKTENYQDRWDTLDGIIEEARAAQEMVEEEEGKPNG